VPSSSELESIFKWIFYISFLTMLLCIYYKDSFPDPNYYEVDRLTAPIQTETDKAPFTINVNQQTYKITPKFDYELNGVVVSLSNADDITNIWHHKRWKDFLNLRDLCVIWGNNVKSGVYKEMEFSSDSWTCWASWENNGTTGKIFKMNALSNNHILTDRADLQRSLMTAEVGDHIKLRGVLAEYANDANKFKRGTSITRDDRGNGACETIYLSDFQIIKKANPGLRNLYTISKWFSIISFIGFICMFLIAPHKRREE
jgi:hypothetical protein